MAENEFESSAATSLAGAVDERLPYNQIAENSLLVALFESDEAWDDYGVLIRLEWFLDRNHRIVFEEMVKAATKGEKLTPFTIASRIRDRFSDGEHTAVKVVVGMHGAVRVGATREFFRQVQTDYVRRKLITVLKSATSSVYDSSAEDIDDLIEGILTRIDATSAERLTDEDIVKNSAPTLLAPVIEELEYIREHGHPPKFLNTGFKKLNEMSWGGFRPGHFNVLAGRPGMGKTSFALNLAENVIRENGHGVTVLFFTLEQRTEEVMTKMLAAISQVEFGKLKTHRLNAREEEQVRDAIESIREFLQQFIVINPDGLAINNLIHTVKQVKRVCGRLDLVVVDYLGLMQPESTRRLQNRTLEIAEITRGLKNLANHEAIPILALAQLNRNADARTDQRPRLSDLRDSGSIEQDADMVMMLHRESEDKTDPGYKKVQLLVTKNRHGKTGAIHLTFREGITVFEEIQVEESEPLPD